MRECLHQFEYLIWISKETQDNADGKSCLKTKDQTLFEFFFDRYINVNLSFLCNPCSSLHMSFCVSIMLLDLRVVRDELLFSCLCLDTKIFYCLLGLLTQRFYRLDHLPHVIGLRLPNILKFYLKLLRNLYLLFFS